MSAETVDFAKIIQDATDMQQRMIQIGRDVERERLLPHLQAIFNAYRKSLPDPKVTMPTALHLAIANAQRIVGEIRNLKPARDFVSEEDKVNGYAESGIRKDQRERLSGRADDFGASACGRSDGAGR